MRLIQRLLAVVTLITCFLHAQGADKYTDENRPYEFGFNIEGEQHRHEKKDENGLIMGEFGFITADGVYHVTVYATDENGNFKILSMKNIRVKPYPGSPEGKGPKALPFPPSSLSDPKPPPPPQTAVAPIVANPAAPSRSCSSCSIPTHPPPPPSPPSPPSLQQHPNYNTLSQNDLQQPSREFQQPKMDYEGNVPQFPSHNGFADSRNDQGNPQDYPQQPGALFGGGGSGAAGGPAGSAFGGPPGSSFGGVGGDLHGPQSNYPQGAPHDYSQQPGTAHGPIAGERNPKQYDQDYNSPSARPGQNDQKPQLISAQMQVVDKNTDIYARKPGEKEGLPPGLTKNDMTNLLYTFNYTVGFHGHHEEGFTNGAKKGYYYITGRNGVRTRVDYEADENGFRPKITQEVLDLVSEDVPKEETEKDEKYGLKGYEFKWLYYPSESTRR